MFFITSDVHGEIEHFNKLLEKWNIDKERLVIMGDMIDRGPDPLSVVRKCMELKEKYGAIILKGNHEEMFENWVHSNANESILYYSEFFFTTIKSFGYTPLYASELRHIQNEIKLKFEEELEFMRRLSLYYDTDNSLFVHAGIDLDKSTITDMGEDHFLWVREDFYKNSKVPKKNVYFGHTPTFILHNDINNHDIWTSDCGRKIGIDGGCFKTGRLNGVVVGTDGNVSELHKINI